MNALRILAAPLTVALAFVPFVSTAKDDHAVPVTGILDFREGSGRAADAFFEALSANSGKVIALVLEIVPRQDANSAGYTLIKDISAERTSEPILCGTSAYGIINNYRSSFRLSFQHPEHFSAPTEILIGARQEYPFHSIRCGVEDYTSKELTHLHVSGHFVVAAAPIPTAISYELYPYAP